MPPQDKQKKSSQNKKDKTKKSKARIYPLWV